MSEVIVTKQNFATLINLGSISVSSLNAFNNEIGNYAKEITEMAFREQQNQQAMEILDASSEVMGVGSDIGKGLAKKTINESLTQNILFKFSESEQAIASKERVGKFWEKLNVDKKVQNVDSSEFLRGKVQNIVKVNEQLLRANKVFTEEEFNKILNGGTNGIPQMLDFELGAGTATDMEADVNILDKCSACLIKNDGEYIFKDFLIIDGSGEALNPKLIDKNSVKFILNFGLQGDLAEKNAEAMNTITAVANYRDRVKKFSKLRKNANLLKVLKRGSGLDTLKKEFNEYLRPLKQAKSIKRAANKVISIGEGTVKLGYKAIKGTSLGVTKKVYKDAKKAKDTKKALSLYKNIKKKKQAYETFEKRVSVIRHPIRTVKGRLAERVKGSKIAKRISEHLKKSKLLNGYKRLRDGISKVISFPFKLIGKAINPIILIVNKIIMTTIIIMLPFLIIVLLFLAIGLSLGGVVATSGVVAVIPLGNPGDYQRWQKEYDTLDDNFLNSLEDYLADYATNRNLKGDKIFYGVNGKNNEPGMENEDYVNGMYYRFITNEKNAGRSSNIEDALCIMAVMMAQSQVDNIEESSKVWEWLYNISHTYTFTESPLYACDSGCHNIFYKCTDKFHYYSDSDIKYSPFHAIKKSGDEYSIYTPNEECSVCKKLSNITEPISEERNGYDSYVNNIAGSKEITNEDFSWCSANSSEICKCYHGRVHEASGSSHYISSERPSASTCNNFVKDVYYTEYTDSEGNSHTESHTYYYCDGHDHKVCQGHNYKCCMGHIDIQMNIEIKFFDEMKDIINKYDFGNNDYIAKRLNKEQ